MQKIMVELTLFDSHLILGNMSICSKVLKSVGLTINVEVYYYPPQLEPEIVVLSCQLCQLTI